MANTQTTQGLSPERQLFLQEMGEVVASGFLGFSVDSDGTIGGGFGKWVPLEDQEPLDSLFKAMRLAGLDPARYKFQQYAVTAANPYHGAKVDLQFPSQLVIKGPGYTGLHQLDLVLRSPFVCAVEIAEGIG